MAAAAGLAAAWWGIRASWRQPGRAYPRGTSLRGRERSWLHTARRGLDQRPVRSRSGAAYGRADPNGALKIGGRGVYPGGRDRLRSALIVGEIALALVLLTGAGLLVRSAIEMQRVSLGFDPSGLISGRFTLPASDYPEPEGVLQTYERIVDEVSHIPGVAAAAIVSQAPLGPGGNQNGLIPEGRPLEAGRQLSATSANNTGLFRYRSRLNHSRS